MASSLPFQATAAKLRFPVPSALRAPAALNYHVVPTPTVHFRMAFEKIECPIGVNSRHQETVSRISAKGVVSGNSPARLRTTIPGAIGRLSLPFFSARQLTKKILGAAQPNSSLAGLLDLDNGLALGNARG